MHYQKNCIKGNLEIYCYYVHFLYISLENFLQSKYLNWFNVLNVINIQIQEHGNMVECRTY